MALNGPRTLRTAPAVRLDRGDTRASWPPALAKIRNLTGLYGYVHPPQPVSSDGTTVPNVVGGIEAIREGEAGTAPIKTYRFYLGVLGDGKLYWTDPFRDTPHGLARIQPPPAHRRGQ